MQSSQPEVASLFKRLPKEIFRPLASPNRERMWELLVHLYNRFFGPDAPPSPAEGWIHRALTLEIERFIINCGDWVPETEGERPVTQVMANEALSRLVNTGWLREETIGARIFIDMPQGVQKFLEVLLQFAEEGPQLLGGKVQLIYHQLVEVDKRPAEGADGFMEAAKQSRQLIALLKNTTVKIRDVLDILNTKDTTAAYISAFFDDYITSIFIRDYHELRTENHPMRHRWEILRIVQDLRDTPEKREALVSRYRTTLKLATQEEAERAFEKDVQRFLAFGNIETYLQRLDDSINQTMRKALASIHYRLRHTANLDRLLNLTVEAVIQADEQGFPIETGFSSGPMFVERLLREPRLPKPEEERSQIRRPVMTLEQRAEIILRREMLRHREVNPRQVREYLLRQIDGKPMIDSDALEINTIQDLVLFAALNRLVHRASHERSGKDNPFTSLLPEYEIDRSAGESTRNPYLEITKFRISRKGT